LNAIVLDLAILRSQDVQLGAIEVKVIFLFDITSVLLKSFVEAMEGLLEIFLLIPTRFEE